VDISKHSDLIYDLGMHRGEDAEFYLRKGFRVVAFEADPELAAFCRTRYHQYVDSGQLRIVEGAIVGDLDAGASRRVVFHRNTEHSVWGTVCSDWSQRNARLGGGSVSIEVNVIDLHATLLETGMPYYMKIDLEGMDMVCVKTLANFQVRPDYISLESNKSSFREIEEEIRALVELGYNSFQAVEQSAIPARQRPPSPPREGRYVDHCFQEGSSGLFGRELGGEWLTAAQVLRLYRFIRLGYMFEGDDGLARGWRFRGASKLRAWLRRGLGRMTGAAVPGWYDTHARHRSAASPSN